MIFCIFAQNTVPDETMQKYKSLWNIFERNSKLRKLILRLFTRRKNGALWESFDLFGHVICVGHIPDVGLNESVKYLYSLLFFLKV